MPFSGFVDSDELKIFRRVLEDYCDERGIVAESERTAVARQIMDLYRSGATSAAELAAALRSKRSD